MGLQIDHVVLCVPDLDRAGGILSRKHGLVSHPGGRHPGHGTANRIVPLGASYLELVAVADPDEAAGSPFGSWVARNAAEAPVPHALCLRTDDLDEVCERLDLEPLVMSRDTPDGNTLHWRLAGLEEVLSDSLPFFVEWQVPDELLPGRMEPGNEAGIAGVILGGDAVRLRRWTANAAGVTIHCSDRPVQVVLEIGEETVALLPG